MDLSLINPNNCISELFVSAKEADEFEYCCSLLRVRGMERLGWDPLRESEQLANQLISFQDAPLEDAFSLRMSLFLYCHLTEMSDLYNIIANMLRVIMGKRYAIDPFSPKLEENNKAVKYPNEKVVRLKLWTEQIGLNNLSMILESMLVKEVRNAFYHSDYILTENSFNIKHGKGIYINHELTRQVPYEWLFPRIELGINTAVAVLNETINHIQSYTKDKVVKGRFSGDGSYVDIQLTTQENYGLTGFKSFPVNNKSN